MRPTLYLHGFLSHPNSAKPKLLKEAHEKIGKPFIAPELYMSPDEVAEFLSKLIKEDLKGGPVDVIGSSPEAFMRRGQKSIFRWKRPCCSILR